jgi:hypothetical protein
VGAGIRIRYLESGVIGVPKLPPVSNACRRIVGPSIRIRYLESGVIDVPKLPPEGKQKREIERPPFFYKSGLELSNLGN